MPVHGNIYMLVGADSNVAMSAGPDGVLLVDTGSERMKDKTLAAVVRLETGVMASPRPSRCWGLHCPESPYRWSSPSLDAEIASPAPPKPIRYIINTSADPDHVGGNATLAKLPADSPIVAATFPPLNIMPAANVVAHENVLNRMMHPPAGAPDYPAEALPVEVYYRDKYTLSEFFNGEPVRVYHVPSAHTDGDSFVFFRYSDVIAAGDLIDPEHYPVIDLGHGGSVNGIIDGLNELLDLMIPEFRSQGGTLVIPGHGRLVDTGDVANYRNMVVIIRDRIQALIDKGFTLEQVEAARPTRDYDAWYGSETGTWTNEKFVEAVYKSLKAPPASEERQ
jgi:glyoxylase-like metal-dependent hydrolase (beta-lactamase superfamily II)